MGAFDHLEWTYDGAFEQLFGLGRGNFPKIQMSGGLPGGMFKLRFDWYVILHFVVALPKSYSSSLELDFREFKVELTYGLF